MSDRLERVRAAVAVSIPRGFDPVWPADKPLFEAGLDSIAMLSLIAELEQRFEITLEDEDLTAENFETLNSLVALVGLIEGRRGPAE